MAMRRWRLGKTAFDTVSASAPDRPVIDDEAMAKCPAPVAVHETGVAITLAPRPRILEKMAMWPKMTARIDPIQ